MGDAVVHPSDAEVEAAARAAYGDNEMWDRKSSFPQTWKISRLASARKALEAAAKVRAQQERG